MLMKKKVLLVDDVKLFLEQQKSMLDRPDVNVICAHDGREALQKIVSEEPDLVFMDLNMPEMDGDRVCFEVKSDPVLKRIPVVMVMQGSNEEDFERCWLAGCDDIIVKPIHQSYFLAVAARHLDLDFRKSRRFLARLRVQYRQGDNDKTTLSNYTVNISTGGMFLETMDLLPVGTTLAIQFALPNRTIGCAGSIAWVNHPEAMKNPNLPVGMGLQFVGLTLDEMNAIRQYAKDQALLPFW